MSALGQNRAFADLMRRNRTKSQRPHERAEHFGVITKPYKECESHFRRSISILQHIS
jgi:hypothetical protein